VTAETVMAPVHPGEILLEEFLGPPGVSQYQLAKAVSVPARRINEIVHGQRRISADTALRLARRAEVSITREIANVPEQLY
jgi:addiction module HigA family antidote